MNHVRLGRVTHVTSIDCGLSDLSPSSLWLCKRIYTPPKGCAVLLYKGFSAASVLSFVRVKPPKCPDVDRFMNTSR